MYIGNPKRLVLDDLMTESPLLDILVETASLSDVHFKHAAAIIDKKGYLKGLGYNYQETTTKVSKSGPPYTVHAEVAALRACDRRSLDGAALVVIRKTKGNRITYSKPCLVCQAVTRKYIKKYGLKQIYYSNSEV